MSPPLQARVIGRYIQEKTDKTSVKRPPKTYAQAQAEVLTLLTKKGWTVQQGLKIPHATAPNKQFRLWFKPQAIYFSEGLSLKNFSDARSAWVPDYRHMSAEDIVQKLETMFAKELR